MHRWVRETEEPNPNFPKNQSNVSENQSGAKRQRISLEPFSLPPVLTTQETPTLLPSMMSHDGVDAHSLTAGIECPPSSIHNRDGDRQSSERLHSGSLTPLKHNQSHDVSFEHVSFDNILARYDDTYSHSIPSDGPPHRVNQALIKPDQIPRLPHLNAFRKSAYQDEVDALYQRLDEAPSSSARYREGLERLTTVSLKLLNDFRDWRRHSNLAPELSFSI